MTIVAEPRPIDMAIEVLGKTRDGNDLAPEHLKLVELAVNGYLNEAGEVAFYDLYAQVQAGYAKPWLQGVEHLTRDHEGYVYWKGQHIEHWDGSLAYSENGREPAQELARRCKILEEQGEPINGNTIVWKWNETPQPQEV